MSWYLSWPTGRPQRERDRQRVKSSSGGAIDRNGPCRSWASPESPPRRPELGEHGRLHRPSCPLRCALLRCTLPLSAPSIGCVWTALIGPAPDHPSHVCSILGRGLPARHRRRLTPGHLLRSDCCTRRTGQRPELPEIRREKKEFIHRHRHSLPASHHLSTPSFPPFPLVFLAPPALSCPELLPYCTPPSALPFQSCCLAGAERSGPRSTIWSRQQTD